MLKRFFLNENQLAILQLMLFLTVTMGLIYVFVQWLTQGRVEDRLFIGILLTNSYVAYQFFFYLKESLPRLAYLIRQDQGQETEIDWNDYFSKAFAVAPSLLFGFFYGALFGMIGYVMGLEDADALLRLTLSLFLFIHNTLIGICLYSLVIHLKSCSRIGKVIPVSLWNRNAPAALLYSKINRAIVFVVALISSLAVLSLYFSVFKLTEPVVAFSLACAGLVCITYLLPNMPLTIRLQEKLDNELHRLCWQMDQSYKEIGVSTSPEQKEAAIEHFEQLHTVYIKVRNIKTFPPIGIRTAKTFSYAVLITLLPTVLDFALKYLMVEP
jgi:hypothetical protein